MRERFYLDVTARHDEVTGTCIPCIEYIGNKVFSFMVDFGCFQEKKYLSLNNSFGFDPRQIGDVLLTHTHMDHMGRIPFLVKKGFNNKIYLTHDASVLIEPALQDAVKIERNNAFKEGRDILYIDCDVTRTMEILNPCGFEKSIWINDYTRVTFLQNGHLPGAACIFVEVIYGNRSINLFFTGDYNNKSPFFKVNPIPDWILKKRVTIVTGSTYGDKEEKDIVKCFEKNVLDAVNRGKTIIVPVFSLGRSQELLLYIKGMQQRGVLEKSVPIYLDGKLAIKYTDIFNSGKLEIYKDMPKFLPDNFTFVDRDLRTHLLNNKSRKIILTTSGMAGYGPAITYLLRYVSDPNALIHFTGYCAEGTLGRQLKEANKGDDVLVAGVLKSKHADCFYTEEFSAHTKSEGLVDLFNQFNDVGLVLVNHGQHDNKLALCKKVEPLPHVKDVTILGRENTYRIGECGLEKSYPTRFI